MNDTYFGQLLISMPNLKDRFFQKSVILICEFSKKAVMGLIINKPILDVKVKDILKNLKLNIDDNFVDFLKRGPFNEYDKVTSLSLVHDPSSTNCS